MDHAARRAALLAAHPEARALMGVEWRTKYIVVALVVVHGAVARLAASLPLPAALLCAYAVGAPLAHALFLAVHECAHDLAFRAPAANRALALLANVPLVLPFAIAFRDYHRAHHRHLGVPGADVDVPLAGEAAFLRRGRAARLAWAATQIVAYAVRPLVVRPPPSGGWLVANAVVQAAACAAAPGGAATLGYLLLCNVCAGGLHPCAGHFFAEHAAPGRGTVSYYGPLNAVAWNVGYHVEHHDLPRVPWSRLPALRALAPECYDLPTCPSWPGAIAAFVRGTALKS